jgi:hypothetical protein
VVTFTVSASDAQTAELDGELQATSTDGTRAVAAVAVGKMRPEAAAEATAGYPKSLDFGTVETGDTASIDVTSLPGDAAEEVQIGHVSAEGRSVPVTRKGDRITVAALATPGSYSGTVDLAPGAEGGDIELTADARDDEWDAVLLLIIGLVVAILLELFLRRRRPELVLKRRLRELFRVVALRQHDAAAEVAALRPRLLGARMRGVPRIFAEGHKDSFLQARADQITESLKNAASDAQRDRWGPDGEVMKELEADVETYGTLLDSLIAVARDWAAFVRVAEADHEHVAKSPLLELLDRRLADRLIGPGGLDRETEAVKTLTDPVAEVAALYERFRRLEHDAREEGDEDAARDAAAARVALVKSVSDAEDAKRFGDQARELAKEVYGPEPVANEVHGPEGGVKEEPVKGPVAFSDADEKLPRMRRVQSSSPRLHMTPPDETPAPQLTAVSRERGLVGWTRRNLSAGDVIFTLVTLVIVVLSGLAVLYYGEDTWGSTGDEITALVWGSTATAGITLARRLVPGTFKTLAG